MKHFPYKVWLYWSKCGHDCIVNSDYRRVNKRSFKHRNKMREILRIQLKQFKDKGFTFFIPDVIPGQSINLKDYLF